ncbi:MAG: anaerobic glycerol-3-phosphate dehydrogenase subunit C, partial [Caldilinea sp.]|nr:anaerobic glycerol-3-phosphate dehydrogenase subunit C [Caldilinea sp.]
MAPISWHSVDLSLDECIKCNICTSYCPVSAVTDLFPGPKYVGPQAQRFRDPDQATSPDHSVDYCSGCRVCNEVCPTGVKIAELNARARAEIVADKGLPLRNRLLGRNELLGKLGSFAPPLANFGLHNPLSRFLAEKVMRIAREAPLPTWSTTGTFRDWLKRTAKERRKSDKKVVYYHGCATMYYEPFIGKAAVAVMEHNGFEVIVPEQNCCGLPLLSNGEFGAARNYHRGNVGKLAGFARAGLPIVGTSTSCTLTLKEEAPELLDMDDESSVQLKMATWDIFEWL